MGFFISGHQGLMHSLSEPLLQSVFQYRLGKHIPLKPSAHLPLNHPLLGEVWRRKEKLR